MDKITAMLKLTRVEHSIMLVVAVLAAELIAGYLPNPFILAMSIITPIFVSMGSFAINDYYDVESDRLNKRTDRPIVNGSIKRNEALWVAYSCFIIGVIASLFINVYAFAIALIFSTLAVLYSYKMKDMLLLGNIYIAFSMIIAFIYGNYVVADKINISILLIGITIFLAGLAREIHGMIRDYIGDAKTRKTRNLIFHIGAKKSSELAFVLYIEAIAISIYMFFFTAPFAYNLVYIVFIAAADAALAWIAAGFILQKKSRRFFNISRNVSLAAMAVALLSFLLSSIFYIHI